MFRVRNIKISVKIKHQPLDNVITKLKRRNITVKSFSNFISFQHKFTYVFFKSGRKLTNHINITQIAQVSKIKKALSNLRVLLKCNIVSVKIDNIIATTDICQQINLRKLLKDQNFKIKKYNNEIFPGLFAKFKKGTAIIFHSGKVVIVGCKKLHHIPWIIQQITRHI